MFVQPDTENVNFLADEQRLSNAAPTVIEGMTVTFPPLTL
jgi:hypothetical protein